MDTSIPPVNVTVFHSSPVFTPISRQFTPVERHWLFEEFLDRLDDAAKDDERLEKKSWIDTNVVNAFTKRFAPKFDGVARSVLLQKVYRCLLNRTSHALRKENSSWSNSSTSEDSGSAQDNTASISAGPVPQCTTGSTGTASSPSYRIISPPNGTKAPSTVRTSYRMISPPTERSVILKDFVCNLCQSDANRCAPCAQRKTLWLLKVPGKRRAADDDTTASKRVKTDGSAA